ncbi:hypothetical protein PR003_g11279 [Phytophthora rubi]|uniref:Uncharacterized protein n=1 Tax=Phytophthora rubi TaxID=129364 RepID=A0A6A3M2E5_9STRA|nr:hypothetical protein PR002_g11949 [Phytophthora rubi]KAE9028954.1 hypothetical protein PR001_g11630 [Phytophthora rubi]KAE9338915.1 hypothetical protein PR003_g11279 [Phytophthora rubi]
MFHPAGCPTQRDAVTEGGLGLVRVRGNNKKEYEEASGICYQAEYNSCTDDGEDEDALLSSDNADADEDAIKTSK